MMIVEVVAVEEVTTRSKGKTIEWETEEAIYKQATEWIQEDNQQNIEEMQEHAKQLEETTEITNDDPSWYAMQQCQIMLPLAQLLQLVPRFTENLKSALSPPKPATTTTFFTNPSKALEVVDTNSPALTVIIKGNEVTGTIMDGGSDVNVISKKTFDTLGIWEWESCPFWLRMETQVRYDIRD